MIKHHCHEEGAWPFPEKRTWTSNPMMNLHLCPWLCLAILSQGYPSQRRPLSKSLSLSNLTSAARLPHLWSQPRVVYSCPTVKPNEVGVYRPGYRNLTWDSTARHYSWQNFPPKRLRLCRAGIAILLLPLSFLCPVPAFHGCWPLVHSVSVFASRGPKLRQFSDLSVHLDCPFPTISSCLNLSYSVISSQKPCLVAPVRHTPTIQ